MKPANMAAVFFAHQFGIVVLVKFVQLHQRSGEPRFPANLARTQRPKEMQDLGRIYAHGLHAATAGHGGQCSILGVGAVQVIGHSASQPVELDPGANGIAVVGRGVHRDRQVFRFQHLQLQGHRQSILGAAVANPHQGFAAFQHRPASHRLQAIKIGQAGGVGVQCPVTPQGLDALPQDRIRHQGLWLDAGTDGVGHIGFQCGIGPGIATHQIPALGAQFRLCGGECRDRSRVGR
jgi:hypothetical protein